MADDNQEVQDAQVPPSTTAEIFQQALKQNAEIQQRSLDEMRRHTDEVHRQLASLTTQHVRGLQLEGFDVVKAAAQLDRDFWDETIKRATVVLQQHGVLPTVDQEHKDGEKT